MIGLIGYTFLKDLSDDGLHKCLFEDNNSHKFLGKPVFGCNTFLLITVFSFPKKLKIKSEKVGYEFVSYSFGNISVLHIGFFALLFNDFFPKLTEGIHRIIL